MNQPDYYKISNKNPRKPSIRFRKIYILCLLILATVLLYIYHNETNKNKTNDNAQNLATSTVQIDKTAQPQPKTQSADLVATKKAMQDIVTKHPELTAGISLVNIATNEQTDVNGDKPFIAASTIKVLVAVDFLHEVEKGKYSLDTPVNSSTARYHLEQMIRVSNNNSWYAFNKLLTYKGEESYGATIGIKYDSSTNSITTNNITKLLTKLYKYELLNKVNTDLLLSFMSNTHNMQLIPGSNISAKTYNKTGRLDGLVHDVAILDDGKNQYALAIYTDGKTALEDRIDFFHKITETIYEFPKNN